MYCSGSSLFSRLIRSTNCVWLASVPESPRLAELKLWFDRAQTRSFVSYGTRIESFNIGFSVSTSNPTGSDGAEAFQQYQDTLREIKQLKAENELNKSREMFASWKATTFPTSDSELGSCDALREKRAGVAVVRTLAKQHHISDHQTILQRLEERANELLYAAAHTLQYPAAQIQLANNMLLEASTRKQINGDALVRRSIQTAFDYYRLAGEQGVSDGWYNLGHVLWTGMGDIVASDKSEALVFFHKAIALGDSDAKFFVGVHVLGQCFMDDHSHVANAPVQTWPTIHQSPDRDTLHEALQWIEQAAASGHGGALYYLSTFYLNGYPPLQISPSSQDDFLRRLDAAVQHDETGDAHFLRGSCYFSGSSGHSRDVKLALHDFLKAASLGHADSAVNAGAILFKGDTAFHIPSDQRRAFQLYERAGELGSIEGWRNVVACYATGEGVKQSLDMAKYIAKTMLQDYYGK
jgi:TPR repeat protein